MKRSLRFLINPFSLTLATLVVVLVPFFLHVPIFELIELRTYDLRFASRGPVPPTPAIVLAMIDEKSLDAEGRWPWPRAKLARVIDALSADGAKVIAFDIGFPEPDDQHPENDVALARAIRESSAAVVLGYFFHMSGEATDYRMDEAAIERGLEIIAGSKYPLVAYRSPEALDAPLLRAYAPESNLSVLTEAAESSGYFSVRQDADATVRWAPLVIQAGEDLFPPLSVMAAWHYLDQPRLAVTVGAQGVEHVDLGERVIPTDETGRLLINYLGPAKTFPQVSIADILAGRVAPGTFRDRIVIVGASATGIFDVRSTPFGPVFPGAEIHATVIDNVLTGNVIGKPAWSSIYDLLAIVLLATVIGITLPWLNAVWELLFSATLFALYVLLVRELFVRYGLWLNLVYPLLAIAINYTALSAHHYLTEHRERKKIHGAFGQYVAPAVVEVMLKDPSRLRLGGEEKVLTVLFSDLQGFTAASERHTPHEMFQFLSEYYSRMTEQIFAYEGMLKEYIGDELMAIFGAPIEQPDHAVRACGAALDMLALRKKMSEEWIATGRPPLVARTGVNSGVMMIGNMGSEYRLTYGVLGDNVNLASRLEGLNKEYRTSILIGENTVELIGDAFVLREVDVVRVVGKRKPVRIYELLAHAGTVLPAECQETLRCYAEARVAYRAQRWDEALALFERALVLTPDDGPSRVMAERCRSHADLPPAADWDGVFEAQKK